MWKGGITLSSKKDFLAISKLINDFVSNLTQVQLDNLMNGMADIKYVDKGIDNSTKEKYFRLLFEIAIQKRYEDKLMTIMNSKELSKKAQIIDFCKFFKIKHKLKDTNKTLISNIINYTEENNENIIDKYNKTESLEDSIDKIAKSLESIMDINEARMLISCSKILDSKSNLMKLAKKLNVFTDRELSYETIVDNIIKSVVEAKIRSFKIRKKI